MPDIAQLLQSGGNGWLYLPFAVPFGALHGLEPGHSKTMMAAYIVAIRGTIGQAVLLGVCAALSHSLIVWIVAMLGLSFGREILNSHFEAWLLIASGVIILGIAAWMVWRTGQSIGWFQRAHHGHHHHHATTDTMMVMTAIMAKSGRSTPAMASSNSRSSRMACRPVGACGP